MLVSKNPGLPGTEICETNMSSHCTGYQLVTHGQKNGRRMLPVVLTATKTLSFFAIRL